MQTQEKRTPRERREISNEEFNAALANEDNIRIIRSVTSGYANVLSKEDRESCGMIALWRTLQYYQPQYNQKLTTSLVRFVRWQCDSELLRQKPKKYEFRPRIPMDQYCEEFDGEPPTMGEYAESLEHIRERMKALPEIEQLVVEQYYFKRMTMDQVGQANGYSKETAREKINKAVANLKSLCLVNLD